MKGIKRSIGRECSVKVLWEPKRHSPVFSNRVSRAVTLRVARLPDNPIASTLIDRAIFPFSDP
ncbi:hypothetical protein, partial [Sphingomonas melonis]|uniref:hypothetical protein n=1 Tax=Sphingomonas melonis TaxID=152682 RepID=UPI001E411319